MAEGSTWASKLEAATGVKPVSAKTEVARQRRAPKKNPASGKTNNRYVPSSERVSFIAFDVLKKFPRADDKEIRSIVMFKYGHMPSKKEINAAILVVNSRNRAATKDFLLKDMTPEVVDAHKTFLALPADQRTSFIDLIAFEIDDAISEGLNT